MAKNLSVTEAKVLGDKLVETAKAAEVPATQLALDKKKNTQAYLDKQPKVSLFLELRDGEPDEEYVNINGCIYHVKRGVDQEVPKDVAMAIRDKQAAEGKLIARSIASMANMEKM